MEHQGVPAVILCTQAFEPLARSQAMASGTAHLGLVTLPHPFASLADETIREMIRKERPRLLSVLTGDCESGEIL